MNSNVTTSQNVFSIQTHFNKYFKCTINGIPQAYSQFDHANAFLESSLSVFYVPKSNEINIIHNLILLVLETSLRTCW